jgi:hypothetical protein
VRILDDILFAMDTHINHANHILNEPVRRESGREFGYDVHVLAIF